MSTNSTTREDAVLNMQITLVPILAQKWNMSFSKLSNILKQFDILNYIDICYEEFNSTGNQGILDELKEYIELQGGTINCGN